MAWDRVAFIDIVSAVHTFISSSASARICIDAVDAHTRVDALAGAVVDIGCAGWASPSRSARALKGVSNSCAVGAVLTWQQGTNGVVHLTVFAEPPRWAFTFVDVWQRAGLPSSAGVTTDAAILTWAAVTLVNVELAAPLQWCSIGASEVLIAL